ncbi:uncharacterized protein LOC143456445 [Clavelina lepadiformis]|uniref:uncharacterized protein LOC143456445 n=1 Tax=Clavelina lepadiformis TaxID=159417 RepID=UPI00404188AD
MPSLSNIVNSNQIAVQSHFNSAFSATSTLGSLLVAAIARARGKRSTANETHSKPSDAIEGSMSRMPVRSWRKPGSDRKSESHDAGKESLPQRLSEESMPVVHDRLPDLSLWNKIDEDLREKETKMKTEDNVQQKPTKVHTKTTRKVRRSRTSTLKDEKGSSKSLSRRKRQIVGLAELGSVIYFQLYCSTGFHIQLLQNGRVTGTRSNNDKFAILEFISIGIGLIRIRGVESGLFLNMNNKGRLYGTRNVTAEGIFEENLEENKYNTYSAIRSRHHNKRSCYLTIGKNGRPRPGCRTSEKHKFSHFLRREVDQDINPYPFQGAHY